MGDKNFRLSHDIRPEGYGFRIIPDLAAATFRGNGAIEMVLDKETHAITMHGVDLTVSSARAMLRGTPHPARVTGDPVSQTLTFAFDQALPAGHVQLEVDYSGVFHKDLRGFYMASGVAVTQFESADARRVFPCFDEPSFKATWSIAIEAANDLAVLSNGAVVKETPAGEGRRLVIFKPTPKMSSYLVALIVGKLVGSTSETVRGVEIRTWSVPDKAQLLYFGQECAKAVLPLLEDYFGTPYVFGKLDQVGIPDFEAGAMENAGCITFREILLLLDPDNAPIPLQKRCAEVITHELAHQWFGNLVTMKWWEDLWLNEAFATWMAFKIVDQWKPGWRMWDDFEAGKVAALSLDAMDSTHPIRGEVLNAEQATEAFDVITYEKGGAMLRMIEGYLGADKFRDGIRAYMKEHAYGNTVADDLWRALAKASGQPMEEVANGWIGRPGFPLVEARRDGNRVLLSQRRFFADPAKFHTAAAAGDPPWLVPIVVRWADDAGTHESKLLLREATGELVLPAKGEIKFIFANRGGAGFYRVKYAPEEIAALSRHRASLLPVERMGLLNDAWALFRAGAGPLSSVLELLVSLAADEDYAVLGEVAGGFDSLERRYATEADRPALRGLVEEVLGPQLTRLGFDAGAGDGDDRRLARAAVLRALALVARNRHAIDEAKSRLVRFRTGDREALDPNLLDLASVAAAREGDAALFDAQVARVATEADPAEKRRALVSLASVESAHLVGRALDLLLTDTVPMQDVNIYMAGLFGNRAARDTAWEHVRANWTAVRKKSAAPMLLRRFVESLRALTHRSAEVEAFLDAEKDAFAAIPQAVTQTREGLRLDADALRRGTPELSEWLRARQLHI